MTEKEQTVNSWEGEEKVSLQSNFKKMTKYIPAEEPQSLKQYGLA